MRRTLIETPARLLTTVRSLFQRRPRRQYPAPYTLIIPPDVEAEAQRQVDDSLRIRWATAAQTTRLYISSRPDKAKPDRPLAMVRGEREAIISDLDPAIRHYIEIVFEGGERHGQRFTVAERFLPLPSAPNFRDIGGYPTVDGRQVRWGQVYRCGGLADLTERDARYLLALNPKLICDLRTLKEVTGKPNNLPEALGPVYRHTPIYRQDRLLRGLNALFFKRNRFDEVLQTGYLRAIDEKPQVFGDLLRRLVEPDNLPAIFHCTAGKDRTGMVCALLLRLLGVPEDIVVADYTLSNLYYDAFYQAAQPNLKHLTRLGITKAQLTPILLANPNTMRTMLAHIRQRYGSVTAYLHQAAGIDERTTARLRANLLSDA